MPSIISGIRTQTLLLTMKMKKVIVCILMALFFNKKQESEIDPSIRQKFSQEHNLHSVTKYAKFGSIGEEPQLIEKKLAKLNFKID